MFRVPGTQLEKVLLQNCPAPNGGRPGPAGPAACSCCKQPAPVRPQPAGKGDGRFCLAQGLVQIVQACKAVAGAHQQALLPGGPAREGPAPARAPGTGRPWQSQIPIGAARWVSSRARASSKDGLSSQSMVNRSTVRNSGQWLQSSVYFSLTVLLKWFHKRVKG